jgi:hypothetical protein
MLEIRRGAPGTLVRLPDEEAADFESVDHDDLRQHETAVHEEFVDLIERRQAAEAQNFWDGHLKNSKAASGRGGSRTVLDLYRVPDGSGV